MHVSYWIGSILDGLVIEFIPPLNQATRGVNILVAVRNENELQDGLGAWSKLILFQFVYVFFYV